MNNSRYEDVRKKIGIGHPPNIQTYMQHAFDEGWVLGGKEGWEWGYGVGLAHGKRKGVKNWWKWWNK